MKVRPPTDPIAHLPRPRPQRSATIWTGHIVTITRSSTIIAIVAAAVWNGR